MKVILQQDIKKVGNKGDILEVSEGYGRNFLLPKKYAVEANTANMNVANAKKKSAQLKKQQETDEAKLMAAQLSKIEVSIPVKIGEGGKLFGSVTGKDVADILQTTHNLEIDKRKIEIKGGIKGVGDYDAVIKVHPEITSTIKVHVIAG
ncbi:large subunit ribosomal protein L9 [Propionispira arboris]|uniref:Large ribosomal subunit protein bL9 n=1 Tax=Propionispira arboris TaxID=84035 RepID=A0A1H7B901_9FIRM|nr:MULTISPECIES: 50S ribosomal protein L9 [Propionispira]SEJ74189.1 large subunit ribosomal protein L9 [Propionispira arboris]